MSGRPRSSGGDDSRRGSGTGRPRGAAGDSGRSSSSGRPRSGSGAGSGRPSAGRTSGDGPRGGPRGGSAGRDGGTGRPRQDRPTGGSARRDAGSGRPRADNGGAGRVGPGGRPRGRDAGTDTFAPQDGLPGVPEDVDPALLDRAVKAELRSLSKQNADAVARYLVAAGQALDDNPSGALDFARAARARAARVGAVREAVGIAAYHAGEWAEALNELRTARRISGDSRNLAVMADCERALGRPAQAVRLMSDPAVGGLDREARIELFIVVAGARRDLGQLDAALAVLARGGLDRDRPKPGSARLWYAYADALEAADRKEEAANWFAASAAIDPEGELDAVDRAANLL